MLCPVHTSNSVEATGNIVKATLDFVDATFDFVATNGNNVERFYCKNFVLSTKSTFRQSLMLLGHCCWCGRGFTLSRSRFTTGSRIAVTSCFSQLHSSTSYVCSRINSLCRIIQWFLYRATLCLRCIMQSPCMRPSDRHKRGLYQKGQICHHAPAKRRFVYDINNLCEIPTGLSPNGAPNGVE